MKKVGKVIFFLTITVLILSSCARNESEVDNNINSTPAATKNISDEESPKLMSTDMDATVQIYAKQNNMFLGTAVKTDRISGFSNFMVKSLNNSEFTFIDFKSISLNEAIESNEKVVASTSSEYSIKKESLFKLNDIVKKGEVSFDDILNQLSEKDFEVKESGESNPPDPSKFSKLKKYYVYNMRVSNINGKEIPLQFFIETITNSKDLK